MSRGPNAPHELHVRVGRLVVDAAALRDGTSPRVLSDTLPDRIAGRLERGAANADAASGAQSAVVRTIADAVAAQVSPYLSEVRRR